MLMIKSILLSIRLCLILHIYLWHIPILMPMPIQMPIQMLTPIPIAYTNAYAYTK